MIRAIESKKKNSLDRIELGSRSTYGGNMISNDKKKWKKKKKKPRRRMVPSLRGGYRRFHG
jgi:hypothetical protein